MEKINNIIKKIGKNRYSVDVLTMYRDCIEYIALETNIKCKIKLDKDLEERFPTIFEKYNPEDKALALELVKDIKDLLCEFGNCFRDYLGELYMGLIAEYGKPSKGQYFTPYEVSKMMAKMVIGDGKNLHTNKGPMRFNDPCCGSGGMCVAMLDVMQENKVNYLQDVIIYANDIDLTCVYMTLMQLNFCGAAAVVEQMDTLTQEKQRTFKTLGYYLQQNPFMSKKDIENE